MTNPNIIDTALIIEESVLLVILHLKIKTIKYVIVAGIIISYISSFFVNDKK